MCLSSLPVLFVRSVRSPGDVVPHDVECEGFGITYTRIACDKTVLASPPSSMENDVDKKVDDSIESFLRSLIQIGPELMSVRRETERRPCRTREPDGSLVAMGAGR